MKEKTREEHEKYRGKETECEGREHEKGKQNRKNYKTTTRGKPG
jgi:hypothetical protein